MAAVFPPRAEQDFRVTSFGVQKEIEGRFRKGGFPAVEEEVMRRRFWQWIEFLQSQNYLVRVVASTIEEIQGSTELRNRDFSDHGYMFQQRYGDRWFGRMHKDRGPIAEGKIIKKWHEQFSSGFRDA